MPARAHRSPTSGAQLLAQYQKAKRYADVRKMLEKEKDIDGVVIATPDHFHAVAANLAMQAGKAVYVQKPLTWSVHESRVLAATAKRTGVVTQMGNQGHSFDGTRQMVEWIRAGVIGPVREVHVWTNRPIWPQGIPRPTLQPLYTPPRGGAAQGAVAAPAQAATAPAAAVPSWENTRDVQRNLALVLAAGATAPPPGLNWDLFLGPAPDGAVSPALSPVQLARLDRLGSGRARRHGRAPHRPAGLGARPRTSDERRSDVVAVGARRRRVAGQLPSGDDGALRVRRARRACRR